LVVHNVLYDWSTAFSQLGRDHVRNFLIGRTMQVKVGT